MADGNAWGPDDQIGAMNHVMQETVVPLLKTVERGKIYDLSQVIEVGAPQLLPFQSPFLQRACIALPETPAVYSVKRRA